MITSEEISEVLDRTDNMLKKELRREADLKAKSAVLKSEPLLRRAKVFKSGNLITLRDSGSSGVSLRQKFWSQSNLLTKAKILSHEIEECDRIDDFDRDFFKPFKIHVEVDRITQKICSKTSPQKYDALLLKIKQELQDALTDLQKSILNKISTEIKSDTNLELLADITSDSIERTIMAHLLDETSIERESNGVERFLSRRRSRSDYAWPVRALIKRFANLYSEQQVIAALSPNGLLFQKGYVLVDISSLDSASWLDVPVFANPELNLGLNADVITDPDLFKTEKIEDTDVALTDLVIPEKELAYIHGLIALFKEGRTKSLSFLFHGPAGTGKTSMAKAIARELGRKLVTVSSTNLREGNFAYALSFLLAKYRTSDYFLLFDECESIWYNSHSFFLDSTRVSSENAVSKLILERTGVTMAFASNVAPPEAFRRRVDYCVELRSPNTLVRERLLKSELAKTSSELNVEMQVSSENIKAAASAHALSVGFYRQAIKMASSLGNGVVNSENLTTALNDISKSMPPNDDTDVAPKVSIDQLTLNNHQAEVLSNISTYYQSVIKKGVADPLMPKAVTVLFRGPSGTGKTIFAEALASNLGIGFRRCSPSTFLSMWVGESEQKIKKAFQDAEAKGYLLFIDEIEGLIRDRSSATTSWQLTQVDEFLTQMENFKGIVVAATNHPEMLDPAFARRFLFKVEFNIPDWSQRSDFLSKHLGNAIAVSELEVLAKRHDLSLGLIRNAITRFKARNCSGGPEALGQLLAEESCGSLGINQRRMGI